MKDTLLRFCRIATHLKMFDTKVARSIETDFSALHEKVITRALPGRSLVSNKYAMNQRT